MPYIASIAPQKRPSRAAGLEGPAMVSRYHLTEAARRTIAARQAEIRSRLLILRMLRAVRGLS